MIRPRVIVARYRASVGYCQSWPDPADGLMIALIDGIPDLQTESLCGANVDILSLAVDTTKADPHTTFAASILLDREHGLVPGARLLALAVTAADGSIAPVHVSEAIVEATRRGASTIVIPLGDHQAHDDVAEAIAQARSRGVVIVAAAGNAHPNPVLFPARLPEVVAVGACDHAGVLLDDCCRGPGLDLVVPALRVRASEAPGREVARSGTSVAAVLAAGLLALDLPPSSNPSQLKAPCQQEHP